MTHSALRVARSGNKPTAYCSYMHMRACGQPLFTLLRCREAKQWPTTAHVRCISYTRNTYTQDMCPLSYICMHCTYVLPLKFTQHIHTQTKHSTFHRFGIISHLILHFTFALLRTRSDDEQTGRGPEPAVTHSASSRREDELRRVLREEIDKETERQAILSGVQEGCADLIVLCCSVCCVRRLTMRQSGRLFFCQVRCKVD